MNILQILGSDPAQLDYQMRRNFQGQKASPLVPAMRNERNVYGNPKGTAHKAHNDSLFESSKASTAYP